MEELHLSEEEIKLTEFADAEFLNLTINSNSGFVTAEAIAKEDASSHAGVKFPFTAPPAAVVEPGYSVADTWFLGIDFGSESLRASLGNATNGKIYPLLFDVANECIASVGRFSSEILPEDPLPVLPDFANIPNYLDYVDRTNTQVLLNFKHLLKLGLPYRSAGAWQPIVQWTEQQQIPLRYFQAILKQLLLKVWETATCSQLPDLHEIMHERIAAVILGHPTAWSDTYIHNLREVTLATEIVNSVEQVMVIDQAIAPLFTLIHQDRDRNQTLQEIALIINIGAQTTDLLLVKANDGIVRRNLHSRGFDYAGLSINQDIVVQLLYPQWRSLANSERDTCDLDRLLMPIPGNPAPGLRAELQKCLISSLVGRELLNVAEQMKLALSTHLDRDRWIVAIGNQPLTVWRRELESLVMQPFIQYLNRELNHLLSSSGVLADEVKSIWKLGGTTNLPSLSRWLEQKLPNAHVEHLPPATVASGLAIAPMYRDLINIARQQYSDYFLLQEICRLNLQSAITPNQLMQQLQNRGVNARACRDRILTLLHGNLPMGLFPWQDRENGIFLSDPTLSSELFAGRLFESESDGTYQPNLRKFELLRTYLQAISATMQQSLREPLVFPEFSLSLTG